MEDIYVLCISSYEYTQIFGIFTDWKKLEESYDILAANDTRCLNKKYSPILPEIYRFRLNEFTAWIDDWGEEKEYYDCCHENRVDIEEIRSSAKADR